MFSATSRGIPSFGDQAWKKPVLSTTDYFTGLPANTLSPATGISFGQTLTANANGDLNSVYIWIATLSVGDRLLITSEADPKNGIYIVTSLGSAGNKWILTRATDADSYSKLPDGTMVISNTGELSQGGAIATAGSSFWILSDSATTDWFTLPQVAYQFVVTNALIAGSVNAATILRANGFGIGAGLAFPAGPSTGDRWFRTDLELEFFYDGTRWLSTTLFSLTLGEYYPGQPFAANTIPTLIPAPFNTIGTLRDVWLVGAIFITFVGAPNNATNFWTITINDDEHGSIVSFNTAGDTVSTQTPHRLTLGIACSITRPNNRIWYNIVKTLTPGVIYCPGVIEYRHIAT